MLNVTAPRLNRRDKIARIKMETWAVTLRFSMPGHAHFGHAPLVLSRRLGDQNELD